MRRALLPLLLLTGCAGAAVDRPSAAGRIPALPTPVQATALRARPGAYPVSLERHVAVTMRDGTKLYADVYRPDAPGKFPVILRRTPYDRQHYAPQGLKGATRGFVMIAQDVRGRYESEGEWRPFLHEADDGYDTVEWAAALPYGNGKVGFTGSSYGGATTLLAAVAHPPHLAAIAPTRTASDYHDGWAYQGGAFAQWFDESWTTTLAEDTLRRRIEEKTNPLDWVKVAPLSAYPFFAPGETTTLAPYFQDWLAHPTYDDYWRALSIEERYGAVTVPALHSGGWYDIFLRGTLRNYVGLRASAASEAARHGQYLVVGPGNHQGDKGEVDFGKDASVSPVDELDWFAAVMSDQELVGKPVHLFVMGTNVWRDEDEWPLARAKVTRFALHARGALDTRAAATEPADSFVYDPEDPVPTRGGGLCCSSRLAAGAMDQRPVESRRDVLLYTTAAFEKDTEVTGPVHVDLYVSSTARDTDFTAKLLDVWPSGLVRNLTDGIVRMRFRDSKGPESLIEPGKIYPVSIDLAGTSNVFLAGHEMRLELSSSNFPRFDRNLNTERSPEIGTRGVKATNTVYHDASHASALVVSIVPDAH
jgi:hypothetical protein